MKHGAAVGILRPGLELDRSDASSGESSPSVRPRISIRAPTDPGQGDITEAVARRRPLWVGKSHYVAGFDIVGQPRIKRSADSGASCIGRYIQSICMSMRMCRMICNNRLPVRAATRPSIQSGKRSANDTRDTLTRVRCQKPMSKADWR